VQDTLRNQDANASCTNVGANSETIMAGGPRRDFRAVAAFGSVATLGMVVIGMGVLMKPPAASAAEDLLGLV